MKFLNILFIGCLFLISKTALAQQEVTYYGDIEPIIITNCAVCHKPGGYGPFPLTSFQEVKSKGSFIGHVVKTRYMPPWKADPEFSNFKNERVLSESDIQLVMDWIDGGMKKGERNAEAPIIPNLMENRTPDLVLEMNEPYQLSQESVEDYRFFNIPTHLKEDTYIESIAYVPGNKRFVHHSRIMADTTNLIRGIDGLSEFDPKALEFQKNPLADEFLYGWVPGNLPLLYPPGTGKKLYANTDLILNIHYAPTSSKQEDRSRIELFFAKEKVDHEIKTLTITEKDITNQPFLLKAETKPTFYVSYTVRENMNLVSLLPHMHYLGKSFKAIAATPKGEAIPLIKIDAWDFNWQSSYLLREPLLIPKGSTILIVADYDNTSENASNPNSPPKDVGLGWNSTDEMMNLIFYYY
ncbi:c-type cytochrome [Constantimarinum furrinae]|uniref:Uncharacterized protein n=1 Tax=Constantimarinum furrinae TaxID=2562285 RepID=A0A7G8PRZ6_9FLAO|nr:cytochrome c [Constantimarinum furrinae]QNJ97112.1 hypothetical protein ALE3EI_0532 [Constantimarinum furrinae]